MADGVKAPEAVRLVVWDLDETFWRGTLTEGGITEYVRAHHDMVVELARRGILSSICSKNDPATVMPILEREGIADYFVFPSVSWEPKGLRLQRLIEAVQLRPETVLFVDDNPNNLAEAQAIVPGIQVAAETFLPALLADPRFKGKDDRALSRLNQYKLLEGRKRDEEQAAGGNEDFLRGCDIRVMIDYDVEANLDRAIELINRTNQLNFTKARLPEDMDEARAVLRWQIDRTFDVVAGLVRVADKYGDYGYVGFFLRHGLQRAVDGEPSNARLLHFCFSCRTLGMGVEEWVYRKLDRPELTVVGDVLTDLSEPRAVDWIRQVASIESTATAEPPIAPQVVIFGGCEANVVGAYLQRYTPRVDIRGSYAANGMRVHGHVSGYVDDIAARDPLLFSAECAALGLPTEIEMEDVFGEADAGALFVANFSGDAYDAPHLRHRKQGWKLRLTTNLLDLPLPMTAEALDEHLDQVRDLSAEARARAHEVNRHIDEHYEWASDTQDDARIASLRRVIERVPAGSRFILLLPHAIERNEGRLMRVDHVARYIRTARRAIEGYPFAAALPLSEVIGSSDEIVEFNHYTRATYLRLAERIASVARTLPARTADFASPAPVSFDGDRRWEEAEALVRTAYRRLFRREPDAEGHEFFVEKLALGWPAAEFIEALTGSQEFSDVWQAKRSPSPG